MRIFICAILLFASNSVVGQNTATINIKGYRSLRSACSHPEAGLALLSRNDGLKIHLYAPGEKSVKTLDLKKKGGEYSFLTTGPKSNYMYVASSQDDSKPMEKNENFKYEVLRVDINGKVTHVGDIKRKQYDPFYITGTAVTQKAFYFIYWQLVRDDKSKTANYYTEFTVYQVLHESDEIKTYRVYIPTAEDQPHAVYDGIRDEKLFFHYSRRDGTKLTTTLWSWDDGELQDLFVITDNDAETVSPSRSAKQTFGGKYRDYTGWTIAPAPSPTNGSLVQITPDPFGTGFYLFKYQQKENSTKFVYGKECTGYGLEYYSELGEQEWDKPKSLTPEMEESNGFKRPTPGQRYVEIVPLDSGIIRLVVFTTDKVYPILVKNGNFGIIEEFEIPRLNPLNRTELPQDPPAIDAYLSPEEIPANYSDQFESAIKNKELIALGVTSPGYYYLITYSEKSGECEISSFESAYKAVPEK